jgi:hypothetical protein
MDNEEYLDINCENFVCEGEYSILLAVRTTKAQAIAMMRITIANEQT